MRDRLIEIVDKAKEEYANDVTDHTETEYIVESLFNNGVVVPPCKVGDTIWFIKWYEEGKLHKPISRKVLYFSWKDDDITIHFRDGAVMSSCIGEFAFLSREEAEAKLQEGKG